MERKRRASSTTFNSPVNFSLSLTELKQGYKLPNHETVHGLLEWEPDPFTLISEWEPDPFILISEWEPDPFTLISEWEPGATVTCY